MIHIKCQTIQRKRINHLFDNDNELEFITIRIHIDKVAGIAVYKVHNGTLIENAFVEEIGVPYRWLNIAAVAESYSMCLGRTD